MGNKWIAQAYGIDALVNDEGEILANVRAGHGDYTYKGRSFIDRASAKTAAERDHGGVEGIDLRKTIASLAARA